MKRQLLTLALGIAAMFTGCQKEDSAGLTNPENGKATFHVAVDNGVQTRAELAKAPTRYIIEVYEVATADAAVSGTPQQRYEAATGSFEVVLKEGTHYACLFWADYGAPDGNTSGYDASDLKAVSANGQPADMAFGGAVRFTYDSQATTKPYLSPVLTHSVAQVNFKQTENFTADGNTLEVVFPKTFSLNLDGNAATVIANSPVTHTFANIAKESGNATIGTSYIIAADAGQTVMDITATFNGEVEKTITNVPFQRNHKTNITGAYSNLYETALSVTCDDAWETPENDEVFPKPKVGDYYYKDGTWSTDNKSTDDNPVIGVIYKVNADGKSGSVVSLIEPTGLAWSTTSDQIGVSSSTDGKANTDKVFAYITEKSVDINTYPIFNACQTLRTETGNDGWYIPGRYYDFFRDESVVTAINSKLTAANGVALVVPTGDSNAYWTSVETSDGRGAMKQIASGSATSSNKANTYKVRFVLDF